MEIHILIKGLSRGLLNKFLLVSFIFLCCLKYLSYDLILRRYITKKQYRNFSKIRLINKPIRV